MSDGGDKDQITARDAKNVVEGGTKLAEGGGRLLAGDVDPTAIKDTLEGAKQLAESAPKVAKKGAQIQAGCCLGLLIFAIGFVMPFTACLFSGSGGCDSAGALENTGSSQAVAGDTEFWITHYDPAKGGINGRDCGGAMIKVCSDSSSPTGYVGKYNGSIVSTGVIAVPQDSKYHSRGKVDINQIPVPLIHNASVLTQAKIIIPGYNKSQPTPVGDHFATTITKPNRLDLACTGAGCNDMWNYWKANKLILDSASGLNGGSKVMGKVVGNVIR